MRNILGYTMYGVLIVVFLATFSLTRTQSEDKLQKLSFWDSSNESMKEQKAIQHTWNDGLLERERPSIPSLSGEPVYLDELFDTRNTSVTTNLKGTIR